MEIRALELENVKSYARGTIAFARGTNAICGPNGSGKSTILEAIGYALFDVPPCRPIGQLVREGEKTATITVTVQANDEREYQVVRRCGSRNQYYVYDPELGQKLVDGTTDVLAWLKEQFGVEDSTRLDTLFRDAVGVPQGMLTAAFGLSPERRKATFDPLLRVEEFNQAFVGLLEAKRALDDEMHRLELQIAGLQAEVRDLPRLEAEAQSLAAEVESARAALEAMAPKLSALEAEKRELEAHRDQLRRLSERAGRLDERAATLRPQVLQAEQAVARAQRAAETVAASAAGHAAYLAAMQARQALERQERARARAEQAAADCRARHQVLADRIRRLERDLQAARAAAAEAEALRPAAEEQERLQRRLLQSRAQAQRWQAATGRLEQERRRLDYLRGRRQQLAADLEERSRLERAEQELQLELAALDDALRSAQAAESREAALLEQLQAQQETLAAIEAARCPICASELPPARRAELQEQSREQAALQADILAGLRSQARELATQRQEAAQALSALRQALSQLPRPAEGQTAEADCERQRAIVQEVELEVAGLAEANVQAESLAAQLGELGDPQAAYQQALALAGQGAQLEADLVAEQGAAAELAGQLGALEAELATFAGLDAELAAVRDDLQAHEPAHRKYLQHEREAAELAARRATLQGLQGELAAAEEERQELEQGLQSARAAHRPEEYERVAAAYLLASQERSRLQARAQMQDSLLAETQDRIAALRATAELLQAAERDLARQREVSRLLDYLRRILKEAGPQVTRALVEIISQQAARLYTDIASDPTGCLRWAEDYEVLVNHSGHLRTFQQLSGGEQMSAALAVRLALLRELSGIDLVFLDEPTSNLDETRRDNLADQILGIKHLAQIFVVSHDDTFERATDHTVRLVKEDGRSEVVS